jgi:Holliday junction DNA helicase RuvB
MAITRTTDAVKERKHTAVERSQTRKDGDAFEQTLRPKNIADYVGQQAIKQHLMVYIQAALQRKEPLGHTLLHGPPGLGKTTLASIIATEMNSNIRVTSGPAIEKPGDLASLLTNLEAGDVLFIDEIHRMRPVIEEVLYSAMEDYALDLVIGKGPTARSMRLELKPFTLIGATTKIGTMSSPLRDRFVHTFKLEFYNVDEMQRIITRTADLLETAIDDDASALLAHCSRSTPRIANRLVRSIRDFAQVQQEDVITFERTESTLTSLGIDSRGLDNVDRKILEVIVNNYAGGPVGLSTLAAATAEEEETLESVYEPYLMQQGYLQRTPKGRMITDKGKEIIS